LTSTCRSSLGAKSGVHFGATSAAANPVRRAPYASPLARQLSTRALIFLCSGLADPAIRHRRMLHHLARTTHD